MKRSDDNGPEFSFSAGFASTNPATQRTVNGSGEKFIKRYAEGSQEEKSEGRNGRTPRPEFNIGGLQVKLRTPSLAGFK